MHQTPSGILFGNSHSHPSYSVTVAQLRSAIAAAPFRGNQSQFAREVMFCNPRQVRRWLTGARMSWHYAQRFKDHVRARADLIFLAPE